MKPWIDPADLITELDDIDMLTADVFGADVPLRDRVATLVADWCDSTELLTNLDPDTADRQADRRNIA